MNKTVLFNPAAKTAEAIESLVIYQENTSWKVLQIGSALLARVASVTVFPFCLLLELTLKRIPKALASISWHAPNQSDKCKRNFDKIEKFVLGILLTPLGLRSPDAVSGLFLKNLKRETAVRPFGVEEEYGKVVDGIALPENEHQLQTIVTEAIKNRKQISVVGAGMSEGTQTVPVHGNQVVINTKKLNKVKISQDKKTVKVQSGATWEDVQLAANALGKSVIVKQASDVFSIGGSIGINCHGWAHEYGAMASTVESLDVILANGSRRTLTPTDELFGCFFGTLGYFGVIVSATLKLTDNEHLIEKTEEVELDKFVDKYENEIKGHDIPLFGGRLSLDSLEGAPLRKVCMVRYEKDHETNQTITTSPLVSQPFKKEPTRGTRIERIALQAVSHLSQHWAKRAISYFWSKERADMLKGRKLTRNEALHPPIKAFTILHNSKLHAQWLQEYFISKEQLSSFLRFLGKELRRHNVRLINATIRPTPRDDISILPYADKDRYAVVLCFDQMKTPQEIEKTKAWIEKVNKRVIDQGDVYYQAYMPFATREQFETCYGTHVTKLREMKSKYDPQHVFGNAYTEKYFDEPIIKNRS